jgi:hypothetical protein
MFLRNCAILLCSCAAIQSAAALTIDSINVSTVNGYGDTHYPVDYPNYDRFSILGAAYSYTLSDGQVRSSGAGWIPYTNGHLANVSITNSTVSYEFDQVYNWAMGSGTIFYSIGQVWCQGACNESGAGLWTEGQFAPVSPIVLTAQLGSSTATLSGTAKILKNNAGSNWSGTPANFLPFSSPEGSVVTYSATYTLTDGSVWDESTFGKRFSYNMTGSINLSPVPESGAFGMSIAGLSVVGLILAMRGKNRRNLASGSLQRSNDVVEG